MWRDFEDLKALRFKVLKVRDDVCEKKRGRKNKGDAWRWNEKVKEAISRKKEAHRDRCVGIVPRRIITVIKPCQKHNFKSNEREG